MSNQELEKVGRPGPLPPRAADSHKGLYGHVLVVGGSRGMIGAPALAVNAALRSGAGLLTVAAPAGVQLAVASLCPCATSVPLDDEDGHFALAAAPAMLAAAEGCDVLAVGPGMGVSPGATAVVRAAIEQPRPLVLDADGLNNLARIDGWPARRRCPLVLTPHPGELGRLTGTSARQVQADRRRAAADAIAAWLGLNSSPFEGEGRAGVQPSPLPLSRGERGDLVLVLKGEGTIVTDGRRIYVNDTGNPGLATGGTGDVLTGVIAALLGQKLAAFEAACLGAYVHGLAGDLAATDLGQLSLIAADVVEHLSRAWRCVQEGHA